MQHKSLAKILVICTCKFGYSFASKTENGAFLHKIGPRFAKQELNHH